MADRVDYCGVPVTRLAVGELLQEVRRAVDRQTTLIASYIHLHTVNLMGEDPRIRDVLAQFDIVIPDGIAVLWSSRLFGTLFRRADIVTTYELMIPLLVSEANRREWSFFLFGAEQDVVSRAAENFARAFPGARIAGAHHGYIASRDSMNAVVALIARAKPTILLVGLGQPKQEEWILRYRDQLGARVILAVGGYFDKLARNASIYPDWASRTRLYWLCRLLTEPERVWKRYTVGVPVFVWNVLRARFGGRAGSLRSGT